MEEIEIRENEIGLRSVAQLLNLNFFIPSYQRGYRWTTQQVKDLLEDIRDFSQQKHQEGKFYCVQPLVVRKMSKGEKEFNSLPLEDEWHEVIDGQQRLTTIYLILTFLEQVIDVLGLPTERYHLKYQRDPDIKDFLKRISKIEKEDEEKIDYFYFTKAYLFIKEWFGDNKQIKSDFCNTLLKYIPNINDLKEDRANKGLYALEYWQNFTYECRTNQSSLLKSQ